MRPPLVTGILAAVLCGGDATAQTSQVEQIVSRATSYAHEFIERFSNVVAEERYEQQLTWPKRKRVLVSDFLLVRYPGDAFWQAFRDVAEVDGHSVRDRQDRMLKLFLEPSSSARRRSAEITEASSRHNLIDTGRLNNPLFVIAFFQRQYVDRFRFNLAGLEKKLGPDVRTVRFVEFRQPTLLSKGNADLPSSGLTWIEEGTGRVVKTELRLGSTVSPIRITTLYTFDEDLGINVPTEMDEWYPQEFGEFKSRATYGKFRRFEVKTDESFRR
jgi:hypothetical protein